MFLIRIVTNVVSFVLKVAITLLVIIYGSWYFLTVGGTDYSISVPHGTVKSHVNTASGLIVPKHDPRFGY
jgi:hypothetical protein